MFLKWCLLRLWCFGVGWDAFFRMRSRAWSSGNVSQCSCRDTFDFLARKGLWFLDNWFEEGSRRFSLISFFSSLLFADLILLTALRRCSQALSPISCEALQVVSLDQEGFCSVRNGIFSSLCVVNTHYGVSCVIWSSCQLSICAEAAQRQRAHAVLPRRGNVRCLQSC